MYFNAYLKTQCLFAWHHGKIKEISQDLRKKIVDLHKSGSSRGAISKRLKVPRSSVQTIVRKYKHGTTQPSYRSGRRRVLSPRDEHILVRKCLNKSQNNSKGPCEDAGGNKYKSIFINKSYIDISWKAAQQGRSHCSKTAIKKPDYGWQLHMGTKIVLFKINIL